MTETTTPIGDAETIEGLRRDTRLNVARAISGLMARAESAEARALRAEAQVAEAKVALEGTIFGLETTEACLRTWNDGRGGAADVDGILERARSTLASLDKDAGHAV